MPVLTHKSGKLYDQADSFGWMSIALHWLSSGLVIALWLLGKSISQQPLDEIDERRTLHIIVGLSAWLLIAARIAWRLYMRHPHVAGQSLRTHRIAMAVHYTMLTVLSLMLLSGPVLALTYAGSSPLTDIARFIHTNGANVLFILVLLHLLGTLKHLMFHNDETIVRMLWPRPRAGD